jgi:hypothetical protein
MAEISKLRAKRLVADVLNQRNGPLTTQIHDLQLGSEVLVWREANNNRQGRWTGPFKLIAVDGETCQVELTSGITPFRSTSVKLFLQEPEPEPVEEHEDEAEESEHEPEVQENQQDPNYKQQQQLRSATSGRPRKVWSHRQVIADMTFYLREDDDYGEPFTTAPSTFVESRRKEINGLLEKGVFEIVHIDDVPEGTRIFNSRFVDEIKNKGTNTAYEKSRLVAQAYNDLLKDTVLTQSPTIQRVSLRILLIVAAILCKKEGLSVFLRDIVQAYTQAASELIRIFYMKAPTEMGLPPGFVLRILKPLYGIPEAGNHWFKTYLDHHMEKLKMNQSTYDTCLLYTRENGIGFVGIQVDDTLIVANDEFAEQEDIRLKEAGLQAKERTKLEVGRPIEFNGGTVTLNENGEIELNQPRQCERLDLIHLTYNVDLVSKRGKERKAVTPKDQYIAQRARGAYIASMCQPEASFDLSYAAQSVNPKQEDAEALNKRIQWQIDNAPRGLKFVPLDTDSLKLIIFTDASFANNKDLSSQIGYVIVLADGADKANIVHWTSVKCKRVTRSILASELYALALGFDIGAALKGTFDEIFGQKDDPIPLVIATDSKSLYHCLVKLGTTHEKRLMIDVMALRQSYERREIAEIRWIDGGSNPADAMTKATPCLALRDLIDTNMIKWKVTEWVERP